jgi:hypothetical protein
MTFSSSFLRQQVLASELGGTWSRELFELLKWKNANTTPFTGQGRNCHGLDAHETNYQIDLQ